MVGSLCHCILLSVCVPLSASIYIYCICTSVLTDPRVTPPVLFFLCCFYLLQAAASDRVGEELAASKSREVDRILGSHASDEGGGSQTFKASALSEASASLDDRNKVRWYC